ncbi:MAG: hypothetical protein IJ682_13740 [Lachnospiraceae bacterium]|nr:hypothetical protein [Lachnospiraceae bacterium]
MRMTRTQMNHDYPNQWLGIRKIEYDPRTHRVLSADVVYTDCTASELAMMSLDGDDVQPLYTTPDRCFQLGFQIGELSS